MKLIFKSLSLIIGKSSVFIVDNLNLERPQFISSKESSSLCEICTSDPSGNLLTISYNVAADTDVSPPILISALIIFAASEIGKKDSLLGAIIVSLPMISLITISWIYFETKDVDRIIDFSYGVFAMIMPSLSFFITLPYFLKKINFIPSMFLSISIMVVLYFALSILYKKIGVDI